MAFYHGSRPGTFPESGAIFMSNRSTMDECYRRRLLGLPLAYIDFVKHIRLGMFLFLFEYERRELYGVFQALSDGDIDIEPDAYQNKFPAQVRFDIFWNCYPIPESSFRDAIAENYYGPKKFKFGLCNEQVRRLLFLFNCQRVEPCTTLENEPQVGIEGQDKDKDNEPKAAIEGQDNEPEKATALNIPADMLPDEYIPLSTSYSSDSEDEPKTVSKGLYSDSLQRKSVFSRLTLPGEASTSKKKTYKSNTADEDENSDEVVTMIDPVPRIKRKVRFKEATSKGPI